MDEKLICHMYKSMMGYNSLSVGEFSQMLIQHYDIDTMLAMLKSVLTEEHKAAKKDSYYLYATINQVFSRATPKQTDYIFNALKTEDYFEKFVIANNQFGKITLTDTTYDCLYAYDVSEKPYDWVVKICQSEEQRTTYVPCEGIELGNMTPEYVIDKIANWTDKKNWFMRHILNGLIVNRQQKKDIKKDTMYLLATNYVQRKKFKEAVALAKAIDKWIGESTEYWKKRLPYSEESMPMFYQNPVYLCLDFERTEYTYSRIRITDVIAKELIAANPDIAPYSLMSSDMLDINDTYSEETYAALLKTLGDTAFVHNLSLTDYTRYRDAIYDKENDCIKSETIQYIKYNRNNQNPAGMGYLGNTDDVVGRKFFKTSYLRIKNIADTDNICGLPEYTIIYNDIKSIFEMNFNAIDTVIRDISEKNGYKYVVLLNNNREGVLNTCTASFKNIIKGACISGYADLAAKEIHAARKRAMAMVSNVVVRRTSKEYGVKDEVIDSLFVSDLISMPAHNNIRSKQQAVTPYFLSNRTVLARLISPSMNQEIDRNEYSQQISDAYKCLPYEAVKDKDSLIRYLDIIRFVENIPENVLNVFRGMSEDEKLDIVSKIVCFEDCHDDKSKTESRHLLTQLLKYNIIGFNITEKIVGKPPAGGKSYVYSLIGDGNDTFTVVMKRYMSNLYDIPFEDLLDYPQYYEKKRLKERSMDSHDLNIPPDYEKRLEALRKLRT